MPLRACKTCGTVSVEGFSPYAPDYGPVCKTFREFIEVPAEDEKDDQYVPDKEGELALA